jgi:hypothetical protein
MTRHPKVIEQWIRDRGWDPEVIHSVEFVDDGTAVIRTYRLDGAGQVDIDVRTGRPVCDYRQVKWR